MSFLLYCLGVYFFYHFFNCSDIAAPVRAKILALVHDKVAYMLGCSFCLTWWITAGAWCAALVPAAYVVAAPVVNLLLLKTLNRLDS